MSALTRTALACCLGACLATPAVSASAGFTVLRLTSGARTSALAEAGTALKDGDALSYNPAALAIDGKGTLGLTHTEWIEDIRHEYLTAAYQLGARSFIGVQAQLFHAGGLERRTGPSVESLGDFGVFEWSLGAAWSRQWTPRLRLGAGAKLLRQSIFTEAAGGAAVDFGALYQLRPEIALGASVRNLGSLNKLDSEATELPRQLRVGTALRPRSDLLLLLDGQLVKGADSSLHMGGEWAWRPELVLRGGYQTADTRSMAVGLGVAVGTWRVDYAFVPFTDDLGEAHRLTLYLNTGPRRPSSGAASGAAAAGASP